MEHIAFNLYTLRPTYPKRTQRFNRDALLSYINIGPWYPTSLMQYCACSTNAARLYSISLDYFYLSNDILLTVRTKYGAVSSIKSTVLQIPPLGSDKDNSITIFVGCPKCKIGVLCKVSEYTLHSLMQN